jgi:hypothetical protein
MAAWRWIMWIKVVTFHATLERRGRMIKKEAFVEEEVSNDRNVAFRGVYQHLKGQSMNLDATSQ